MSSFVFHPSFIRKISNDQIVKTLGPAINCCSCGLLLHVLAKGTHGDTKFMSTGERGNEFLKFKKTVPPLVGFPNPNTPHSRNSIWPQVAGGSYPGFFDGFFHEDIWLLLMKSSKTYQNLIVIYVYIYIYHISVNKWITSIYKPPFRWVFFNPSFCVAVALRPGGPPVRRRWGTHEAQLAGGSANEKGPRKGAAPWGPGVSRKHLWFSRHNKQKQNIYDSAVNPIFFGIPKSCQFLWVYMNYPQLVGPFMAWGCPHKPTRNKRWILSWPEHFWQLWLSQMGGFLKGGIPWNSQVTMGFNMFQY